MSTRHVERKELDTADAERALPRWPTVWTARDIITLMDPANASGRISRGANNGIYCTAMDPTLSGFALGLVLAAAKVGALGTAAFAVAWWRTRKKLRRLEESLPDPAVLAERLANLEQLVDYSSSQLERLIQSQDAIARQLPAPPVRDSV